MDHTFNSRYSVSAILLVLVALFILGACQQNASQTDATETATSSTPSIVFIYADSILAKYEVFQEKGTQLAQREQEENAKLQELAKSLEQEVKVIQGKVQQGLLAPNQIAREEQRIGQKQQEIMLKREAIAQELQLASQQLNQELQEKLKAVLQEIQQERAYDYILSYGAGTGVMMVNDELDISDEVLTRLNADNQVN